MLRLIFITPLLIMLTACSLLLPVSSSSQPVEDTLPAPSVDGSYLPLPQDENLARGTVELALSDLLTLESYPLQYNLHLKGTLPSPCHQLRIAVDSPDEHNQIQVDVYSVVDPQVMCAQVLQEFEVTVSLGSYPTGSYSLQVNEKVIAEFQN